jgi:hypothetical protein
MSKVIGFLFPWRKTFKRLELEKRWWHRLAIVVFFVALLPTLLYSWILATNANGPVNSFEPDISYLAGPPPSGTTPKPESSTVEHGPWEDYQKPAPPPGYSSSDVVTSQTDPYTASGGKAIPWVQKTIDMPDGKTVKYPGTTPDETIKAEWQHKRSIAEAKAMILGFGWAVLVTVLFSYLLQAAYRALVYVIYGAKARAAPNSPVEG